MIDMPVSSALDRWFKLDYNISICSFPAKNSTLTRKNKHWLARNHDNMSTKRNVVSTCMYCKKNPVQCVCITDNKMYFKTHHFTVCPVCCSSYISLVSYLPCCPTNTHVLITINHNLNDYVSSLNGF